MQPLDTAPEVQKIMDDYYRQMTPAEKWACVEDAWDTARAFALAGLRMDYPEEADEQLENRWAERRLGTDLYKRAMAFKMSLLK